MTTTQTTPNRQFPPRDGPTSGLPRRPHSRHRATCRPMCSDSRVPTHTRPGPSPGTTGGGRPLCCTWLRRGQCPRASPLAHGDDRSAEAPWSDSPRGDRPPHVTTCRPRLVSPVQPGLFHTFRPVGPVVCGWWTLRFSLRRRCDASSDRRAGSCALDEQALSAGPEPFTSRLSEPFASRSEPSLSSRCVTPLERRLGPPGGAGPPASAVALYGKAAASTTEREATVPGSPERSDAAPPSG